MEKFEIRMILEYRELDARTQKLEEFLNYTEYEEKRKSIKPCLLDLMGVQLHHMRKYRNALCERMQIMGVCFNAYSKEELEAMLVG